MVEKKGLSKIPTSARSVVSETAPPGQGQGAHISARTPDSSRCQVPSPRDHGRRSPSPRNSPRGGRADGPHDALKAAVREAVRLELAEFFGNGAGPRCAAGRGAAAEPAPRDQCLVEGVPPAEACDGHRASPHNGFRRAQTFEPSEMSDDSGLEDVHVHFQSFTEGAKALPERDSHAEILEKITAQADANHMNGLRHRAILLFVKLWTLKEPDRTGCLANIESSSIFERVVQFAILLNCVYMGFSANEEMANFLAGKDPNDVFPLIDIGFQMFYTVELILKLVVHRLFFFWNRDAGYNSLDLFLVMIGFFDLVGTSDGASGSSALRTVRILKMAKALRALRVISRFRNLRAILVCIQGSFVTLLWSVLMLLVVFYMFSLIFVQSATSYLLALEPDHQAVSINGESGVQVMTSMFGSVEDGMLTLAMAAFGGEDWGVSYNVVSQCGWTSSLFHLAFVAFTQIALINIITGIFVDSAMQNLAPGKDAMALDLQLEEEANIAELTKLCHAVDDNCSGTLSIDDFAKAIEREKFPLLLSMLGLNRVHVERFFEVLSAGSPDGEVEIHSFVQGCMRLRGAATSFDLQMLMVNMNAVKKQQVREFERLRRRIHRAEAATGPAGGDRRGGAVSVEPPAARARKDTRPAALEEEPL